MSLEAIDRYLSELNAVKNYDNVIRERDTERSRAAALEKKLEKSDKTISDLESTRSFLPTGKTLGEARSEFLASKEEEIAKRVDVKFERLRSEWEKTAKPDEVKKAALGMLASVLTSMSGTHEYYESEIEKSGLPDQVKSAIEGQVRNRMDQEFEKRVDEKANKKAQDRLDELIDSEWPKFLAEKVTPKAEALEQGISENLFRILASTTWTVTCDKCGTAQGRRLAAAEVSALLERRALEIQCSNPECTDWPLGRHRFSVTLSNLILGLIVREEDAEVSQTSLIPRKEPKKTRPKKSGDKGAVKN
jgi:hypothetical protein